MKIRNGFVSNSSSSSFLISHYSDLTADDFKKEVVKMVKRWRNKEFKKKCDYMTEENIKTWHNRVQDWWSDENIEDCIYVEQKEPYLEEKFSEEAQDFIKYWYSPRSIQKSSIVIYDDCDNFIPEEVCKKIVKKYKEEIVDYCTHMG